MILGLIEPGRGSVYVDSTDVAHASGGELRRLRRQMQPVFQDPYAALNPRMNVLQIVTEPLVIHKREVGIKTDSASLRAKAVDLLNEVGMDDSALGRPVGACSPSARVLRRTAATHQHRPRAGAAPQAADSG
jgi:peptide/nickel transport system ATP-binding protein